jgi:hypothetical protein
MSTVPGTGPEFPEDPERKAASASLGELIGEVSKDFSTLFRQELELAKAELQQSAVRTGKGAGLFGGAGVSGLYCLLFLSVALWWGLGYLIGNAWSGLVVAVIWAIIALITFLVGRRELKSVRGMPETVDSLKKIPDTLKRNGENS